MSDELASMPCYSPALAAPFAHVAAAENIPNVCEMSYALMVAVESTLGESSAIDPEQGA